MNEEKLTFNDSTFDCFALGCASIHTIGDYDECLHAQPLKFHQHTDEVLGIEQKIRSRGKAH